ncbi:hypothetical protein SDC9_129410 [bioreactor metagenome]|uniref:Uncharacterized protein n=1 Tax=bioreactor metagenome TaxID=1076179 RepID=A0A645CZK7_9ZZZZ
MDTINKCLCILTLRNFSDKFGYRPVGQKHKFFDEVIGLFRFFKIDTKRFTFLIEVEFHFVAFKIDGSIGKTLVAQFLGQAIHRQYLR